ncbi:PaaI family thioesterase [Jannaschia sp. S6380]|uniref:PaaI family thioesterase n=1 Tax=Jannaschia sp. S6380 TaxID=2926408 RepID=UPI001FF3E333|nr:PaaI family thioesterase [Jannaschia sp. S6380]MCK0168522.1 PaaI family thioesterase [Jannaschia sp. S6380]
MGDGIIRDETGAQRLLGYVLDVGAGDGRARCRLTLTGAHTNRHGALHGGIAAAMLDNALGATASLSVDGTGRAPFLTISMTTQFLAPAHAGDELVATGRLTGGGRSTLFVEGVLERSDGTLIATATGVFKRVPAERLS